jgi:purine-binding chemotaxis protein CheW
MDSMIVFRIGDEHIGVDITSVREVTEIREPVKVPRSPHYILGMVNIRGNILPVISLRRRLGLKGDETDVLLLVVEHKDRIAGLKIDEMYGTKKVLEEHINKRSELLSTKTEKDFFYGVYEAGEKPILLLDLEKVLLKEDK